MKGLLVALAIIAVMAMAVGALVLELRLAARNHPARLAASWLAWGTTAAVAGALLALAGDMGLAEAVSGGALMGFVGYPIVRLRMATNTWGSSAAEEHAKNLERMKYLAMDFGGVAGTAPSDARRGFAPPAKAAAAVSRPPADAAPLTRLPVNAALADVVADRRPLWARAAEQGVVALICVGGLVLWLVLIVFDRRGYRSDAGAPEAVAELLEMNGFAAPKVERQMLATHCYQSFAYRWTAMGAKGRACVNYYDGEIEVKIDRTWSRPQVPAPPSPA